MTTAAHRSAQLDAMGPMFAWLAERPALPLPLHGAWAMPSHGARYGEDGDAFHVFARTPAEFDRLAGHFDECEEAPPRPHHPRGVRRRFGPIAYEVLLDADWFSAPFGEWRVDRRPGPIRNRRLDGLRQMVRWLAARPALTLPTLGARLLSAGADTAGADDLVVFASGAASRDEQRKLLALFDRVERWPADQPAYVEPQRRHFAGGITYEVAVE